MELVRKVGADKAVDGKRDDVARAARAFAPGGLDAALALVHGASLAPALAAVRKGGRIAYPNGVDVLALRAGEPAPSGREGVAVLAYDGVPGRDVLEKLNRLIAAGPFHVEVGRSYRLEDAARAHRELGEHHLGKLALRLH
jgi:NADPH:quinone reductase-like Zn-dependent oxidoreductase